MFDPWRASASSHAAHVYEQFIFIVVETKQLESPESFLVTPFGKLLTMRLRPSLIKIALCIPFLIAIYYIRCQYVFQCALPNLFISLNNFPQAYTAALNASRTHGEPLLDFDYNTTFTSSLIPHRIHFIYFADLYHLRDGTPSLPATSRSHAPELCQKYNPTYEIRIWNEIEAHSFIEAEYLWFLPTYDHYTHPIQRVDALKYFVLYHYGGIYMDLDIACRRPLDPLLQFPAWFPEASPLGVNNDLMASMPRHPIFLEMTSALARRNWNLVFPYLTVFWSTGPQFSSDMLRGWWWMYSARMDGHGKYLLPSTRLCRSVTDLFHRHCKLSHLTTNILFRRVHVLRS